MAKGIEFNINRRAKVAVERIVGGIKSPEVVIVEGSEKKIGDIFKLDEYTLLINNMSETPATEDLLLQFIYQVTIDMYEIEVA